MLRGLTASLIALDAVTKADNMPVSIFHHHFAYIFSN